MINYTARQVIVDKNNFIIASINVTELVTDWYDHRRSLGSIRWVSVPSAII